MLSWQPVLSLVICQFMCSVGLRSKLNSKKKQPHSPQKSFTDHRRRDRVIIIFPISVNIVFLNERQAFMAGQPQHGVFVYPTRWAHLELTEALQVLRSGTDPHWLLLFYGNRSRFIINILIK